MTTARHSAYGASQSLLTTQLDSLANNANTAAGTEYNNSTNRDMFMDLRLTVATQGVARSAGAVIEVYITPALDGTNYPDVNETTAEIIAVFPLDAATTARVVDRRDIPVPGTKFKLFARNRTGQSLASSGNIVAAYLHGVESV
jgi:hypothetical protein